MLSTCVEWSLSIIWLGCVQYVCNIYTRAVAVAPRCCTVCAPPERVTNGDSEFQCRQVQVIPSVPLRRWSRMLPSVHFRNAVALLGKHILKREVSASEELSAEYQILLLLELL